MSTKANSVIDRLVRNPAGLYWLLATYFAVNVLLRLAGPASLEFDESQQLFFAQWFAIGYDSQPPFYNWLQYGVVQLLGDTMLALTLLKNTLLFLSYLLFGLAAHIVLRDRILAVIATLDLIIIPQIGYEAQRDLTHTVALLLSSCMFLYCFLRTLERPTALNYALTGIAVGIGILSKYNFVLMPAVAVLSAVSLPAFRARVLDPRVLLTALVAVIIVTPHAIWFLANFDDATQRTLSKLGRGASDSRLSNALTGIGSLAGAIVSVTLPTIIVFALAFGRDLGRAWRAQSQWTMLLGTMMVAATLILFLATASGEISFIDDRWIAPLFLMLPLYLCAKIEAAGDYRVSAKRRFGGVVIAVMVLVPLVLIGRPFLGFVGIYSKQNVPYGPAVTAILETNSDRPSLILAGDQHLAGNILLHTSGLPVTIPVQTGFPASYMFDANHPLLVISRNRNGQPSAQLPQGLQRWLKNEAGLPSAPANAEDIALPYHYGRNGDLYHFSYAWIYPDAGSGAVSRSE